MNFRAIKKATVLAITGAVSVLSAAAVGATGWRTFHPSSCVAIAGYPLPAANSAGQSYNPGPSASSWICPVMTDSALTGAPATYAEVWGYQNYSQDVKGRTCRTYYGGGGGVCDPAHSSAARVGVFSLSWTPGTAWSQANPADSLYLLVDMGTPYNGSYDVLFGYAFNE